jgi:hypothetical protein
MALYSFSHKGGSMDLSIIKKKAKALGVMTEKKGNDEIVKAIQQAEGNLPCFKSSKESCDQYSCLWRKDCMPPN